MQSKKTTKKKNTKIEAYQWKKKSRRSLSNKQQSPGSETETGTGEFIKVNSMLPTKSFLICGASAHLSHSYSLTVSVCLTVKMRRSEHHWICDWTKISIHWLFLLCQLGEVLLSQNACWSDNIKRASAPSQSFISSPPFFTPKTPLSLSLPIAWWIYIYGIVSYAVDWFAQIVTKMSKG